MKEKYIEERYPLWFSMSIMLDDISDANTVGIATAKSIKDAKIIQKEHNKVIAALIDIAQAWEKSNPDTFKEFWYSRQG